MESTLEIKGIEEVEAKNGRKYHKVKTDIGTFSIFEETILNELKKCYGNEMKAVVEIVENEKGFKNIREFKGIQDIEVVKKPAQQETKELKSFKPSKDPVGMTIEVFNNISTDHKSAGATELENNMKLAIDLVKQAIKAFE